MCAAFSPSHPHLQVADAQDGFDVRRTRENLRGPCHAGSQGVSLIRWQGGARATFLPSHLVRISRHDRPMRFASAFGANETRSGFTDLHLFTLIAARMPRNDAQTYTKRSTPSHAAEASCYLVLA